MTRTKLANRVLPDYTKGEEIANMVTHIIGAVFGVVALVFCVIFAAKQGDPFRIASSSIYGASLILLYTMSSVYHGLRPNMKKTKPRSSYMLLRGSQQYYYSARHGICKYQTNTNHRWTH